MYRRHGNKLSLVFLICDLATTAAVWLLSFHLRFEVWRAPRGVPEAEGVVQSLPVILLLAAISYRICGLYEVHRLLKLPSELGTIIKASGLMFVLTIAVQFYRREPYESRLGFGLFLVLNVVLLAMTRRLIWAAVSYLRNRGMNHGRAVIVGTGHTARRVADTIRKNTWTGLEPIGFVDRPGKTQPTKLPWLGSIDDLPQIVAEQNVDHVFVALPVNRYQEVLDLWRLLSGLLVEVQFVPDLRSLAGMRVRMVEIEQLTFCSLRENPHFGWHSQAKRAMDLALGGLAILFLAPLMLLLALLVKLSSKGPVFYRQPRVGLGGKQFDMLKFRSMRLDAELQSGPVWATKNDDRCTPIGQFMRKWSLDELPQLFNVIRGEMSLVGPRPERWVFIEKFREQLPSYSQRHQVKAGITGWAQVNGWRGNTSLRRRLECDLYYICHWSIWLDLKILWMTVWRGFRHPHAY